MTPKISSKALTHALVLKFLESNNYATTLESFRQEAQEVIENEEQLFEQDNEQTKKPLTAIIQEYLFNQLQSNIENMSLER